MAWKAVCDVDQLTPNRGVAALFGEQQVAIFKVGGADQVLAVDNVCPFSGAAVMSRGIVGSHGDAVTVASPGYKQRFNLRTGACLDDPTVRLATFAARIVDGRVEVDVTGS
jgi:nitrite reductase (NADH) small subunit